MDIRALAEQPLTVVQLLPSLEGGGVERGTIEIAAALCEAGHRSVVISAGGRLVKALEQVGSEHLSWPIGKKRLTTLLLVAKLRAWLCANHVDVMHARSRVPAWIAWLAWRSLGLDRRPRFVTTVHGLYSVSRYSAIMTRGERVIAVSEAARKYALQNYPALEPSRIQVIHRGIDYHNYSFGFTPSADWLSRWRKEQCKFSDAPIVMLPGRLTRLKGHQFFIQLIRELVEQKVNVCGLIVGGEDPRRTSYAQSLYAAAKDLPVRFLGHRTDLRELMAVSNVVLSLSEKPESFGRTTLEALALGVPVVGFNHGGVAEILARLYPSGAVTLGDTKELCARVVGQLESPVAVTAEQAFPLSEMQNATLSLYADLAAEKVT